MKIALILCLVLAAACKTDGAEQSSPSSTGGTAAAPGETSSLAKPRSGKIDLPPRLPHDNAPGSTDREPPRLDPGAMTDEERAERFQLRQERRDARRKDRMEVLDTDKNGEVSPDEMQAGRKQRAQDMRDRADTDGDGKVSVQELGEGRLGRRLDLTTVDANKDGDVSSDELAASMEKMREQFRGMRARRGGDGSGSAQ